MRRFFRFVNDRDIAITRWMARNGVLLLRLSLGIIYLWFGALKFVPGLSPADDLAGRTIKALTFGRMTDDISLPILAVWECLIGIGLLSGVALRVTLLLLFLQMVGAVTPLFLFPDEVFSWPPLVPTLEGQYIIKNLVLVSAAIVIGATVRGGRVMADPGRRAAQ